MVDQLADEYAGQPVLFLEQYYYEPLGDRQSRFWAAHGYGSAGFPMVMVDSGHQVTDGAQSNYHTVYKNLVDAERSRAPGADLSAEVQRVGNHFRFTVQVTNRSGVTLSTANSATVHALVYEDAHVGLTSRYVRAAAALPVMTPLADVASAAYLINTDDLSEVDWNKLHTLVMVDYRPGGASGAYDMLQAAVAAPPAAFGAQPAAFGTLVDQAAPRDKTSPVHITGSVADGTWRATTAQAWITITPSSGPMDGSATVTIRASLLAPGMQTGSILLEALGSGKTQIIPVWAWLGEVNSVHLPLVNR